MDKCGEELVPGWFPTHPWCEVVKETRLRGIWRKLSLTPRGGYVGRLRV